MQDTHPLKVIKFCPKCGSSSFEVDGERSFKCKSCGFHLFFNSSAAVAALVSNDTKQLMLVTRGIEPDYGKLDLPGGFIDPGESAEDAIKRELFEELGMKIKTMKYICSAPNEYVYSGFSVFTLDIVFEVVAESLTELNPMDDILGYKFYSRDEINYDDISGLSIRKFVQDYFEK